MNFLFALLALGLIARITLGRNADDVRGCITSLLILAVAILTATLIFGKDAANEFLSTWVAPIVWFAISKVAFPALVGGFSGCVFFAMLGLDAPNTKDQREHPLGFWIPLIGAIIGIVYALYHQYVQ